MKEENEIDVELKQLLDILEEHGRDVRRQKALVELIDNLESSVAPTKNDVRHRKFYLLWCGAGVAAAVLLFLFLAKPAPEITPAPCNDKLVEQRCTSDYISIDEVATKGTPAVVEEILAEQSQTVLKNTSVSKDKTIKKTLEIVPDSISTVETTVMESTFCCDTIKRVTVASITSVAEPDETAVSSNTNNVQRRVIQSHNLVCFSCKVEYESEYGIVKENKSIFDLPQDPNIKNGALAIEIKLN